MSRRPTIAVGRRAQRLLGQREGRDPCALLAALLASAARVSIAWRDFCERRLTDIPERVVAEDVIRQVQRRRHIFNPELLVLHQRI